MFGKSRRFLIGLTAIAAYTWDEQSQKRNAK